MTASTVDTTAPQIAINDIGSEEDLLAAIDATIKHFNDGDIVEGRIVKVDRDEVLLDIGYKTEGVIPSRELSIKHDVDPNEVVSVGDEVEALVLQKEDKEGRLILSKKRAQYERAWGTIEKIKEEDGVVTGSVIEVVKGGLILDIGLRGFLPASLVEMRRVRDLQPYVGKEIEAKIIELDKNRNNVVLSRRAWLEQTQSEVRTTFLKELGKGQVRSGVVSSIVNFGAFVDLGGVDGLVHVSELSWKHIDHPSEVVEVGDEVTVEVLDVDMDRERVSLSLKATQEDPWQHFARTHAIGQVVPGKVTKLVPFGAFVRVDDGIEGLVHISELAERHVELPEQVVTVGTDIFVKVIDIDLERRRISLSLKQANEDGANQVEFDPTLYGMAAEYDDKGDYKYPEGFDPETNEWLEGFESQRETWEKQYAEAHSRWEAHRAQVEAFAKADAEAAGGSDATSYSSESGATRRPTTTRAAPRVRRLPRPRAPSPPTRRWPPCARSSPETEPRRHPQADAVSSPHEARSPTRVAGPRRVHGRVLRGRVAPWHARPTWPPSRPTSRPLTSTGWSTTATCWGTRSPCAPATAPRGSRPAGSPTPTAAGRSTPRRRTASPRCPSRWRGCSPPACWPRASSHRRTRSGAGSRSSTGCGCSCDRAGPLEETEPLARPVTVHDLLTMTSGLGIRFDDTPLARAMGEAGVHPGPVPPTLEAETFLARLGELPLAFQPGGGWAYHTSTDVLSVVLARASGVPIDRLLAERLTGPLDAPSLSFSTPDPAAPGTVLPRPGRGLGADRARRTRGPRHAHAVVRPLGHRHGHRPGPRRARPSHCPPGRRGRGRADPGADGGPGEAARPFVPEGYSFGHQVSVATADDPQGPRAGSAGWSGGTGTLGIADPAADRTVVLLTNRGLDGPLGTAAFEAALADLWSDVRDG